MWTIRLSIYLYILHYEIIGTSETTSRSMAVVLIINNFINKISNIYATSFPSGVIMGNVRFLKLQKFVQSSWYHRLSYKAIISRYVFFSILFIVYKNFGNIYSVINSMVKEYSVVLYSKTVILTFLFIVLRSFYELHIKFESINSFEWMIHLLPFVVQFCVPILIMLINT